MEKDPRLDAIRILIETGHIKTFREIFEFVPVNVLADITGNRFNRMVEMKKNPRLFRLLDFIKVAEVIGVDEKMVIDLAMEQV